MENKKVLVKVTAIINAEEVIIGHWDEYNDIFYPLNNKIIFKMLTKTAKMYPDMNKIIVNISKKKNLDDSYGVYVSYSPYPGQRSIIVWPVKKD